MHSTVLKNLSFYISEFIFFFSLLFLFCLILAKKADAKVIYFGTERETLNLAYGGPSIFRFSDEVKTISQASRFDIHPADEADPNYALLSVTPRFMSGKSDVTFILASGAIVNVNLNVVTKTLSEKTDSFYDFKPKEMLLENENSDGTHGNVSDIELMKAMIRWDKVVGYQTEVLSKRMETGIDDLSAKLHRVYTGARFNGYVFEVRNNSNSKSYFIDLKSLSLGTPNLALISQVDRATLSTAKSKDNVTYLRIVAKPTSVYYNVHLPIAPLKTDNTKTN